MEFSPEQQQTFDAKVREAQPPITLDNFETEQEAVDFVNWCLMGGYNDKGIERWWNRARTQLDGSTPTEAWATTPDRVIGLAVSVTYPISGT